MELDLKGRVAVITGPAKGMGAAVTRAFAAEGCRLALLGRDTAAIEPVADEIRVRGAEALTLRCDMTDAAACEAAASAALEAFGRIDVLINVAGGSGPIGKTGAQTTTEEFREIVDLNMRGCFNVIRAVAPSMMARKAGKIVNVGGTFGMRGRAGRLAYSASKWGLRGITKSFALELGAYNVNVNCVAPGMVDGPRFREKVCREMAGRLGRLTGPRARPPTRLDRRRDRTWHLDGPPHPGGRRRSQDQPGEQRHRTCLEPPALAERVEARAGRCIPAACPVERPEPKRGLLVAERDAQRRLARGRGRPLRR